MTTATTTDLGVLDVLAILGDGQRRDILVRLASGPVCTCSDLVEVFAAKQPTISHHLKVLRDAGLITGERCGRFTNYRAVPERLAELSEAFAALAAGATDAPAC